MRSKIAIAFVTLVLCALLLSVSGSAKKGVGIKWLTEKEMVTENAEHCIEYGTYNPWDEDVYVYLSVSGDLKEVITSEHSEPVFVPAETSSSDALPVKICFTVSKVYQDDCWLGPFLCEQTCQQDEVSYEGQVVAMEAPGGNVGTGSATALGVSVPLRLRVRCNPFDRDWTLLYVIVIIVVLILIGLFYRKKKRK